ncbi:MAG: response regulator [Candidatus Aminicenantes bacterium]|jgi:DNA-binding response OmpR family regulator
MAKIMIIEDNPVHNVLLCHSMEDAGHKTMPFYDYDSAKDELKNSTPDLFILDFQIKGIRTAALDFIKGLMKSKHHKRIPIIIISAYVTKEDIEKQFPGFDIENVIEKPFNVETITTRVRELLKKSK